MKHVVSPKENISSFNSYYLYIYNLLQLQYILKKLPYAIAILLRQKSTQETSGAAAESSIFLLYHFKNKSIPIIQL